MGLQPTDKVLEQEVATSTLLANYYQLRGIPLRNPVELFQLAEQGDDAAAVVVEKALDRLAIIVANAILVVNPERVIVGGGLATVGDLLLKPLRERVESLLAISPPEFVPGRTGTRCCPRRRRRFRSSSGS